MSLMPDLFDTHEYEELCEIPARGTREKINDCAVISTFHQFNRYRADVRKGSKLPVPGREREGPVSAQRTEGAGIAMVCSLSRSRMYKRRGATWARHDRHARAAPRPKGRHTTTWKQARFDRNDGTHPIYRDGSRADCFSNPRRGGGAGGIGGAKRRKRICNGVGNDGEGGDGAGFAAAFDAEWVGRAARADEAEVEGGEVVGAGHRVIHKRGGNYRAFISLARWAPQRRRPCRRRRIFTRLAAKSLPCG